MKTCERMRIYLLESSSAYSDMSSSPCQGRSHWSGWSGFNLTTFGTTQVGQANLTTWSCWYCIQPGPTAPLLIGGYGPAGPSLIVEMISGDCANSCVM